MLVETLNKPTHDEIEELRGLNNEIEKEPLTSSQWHKYYYIFKMSDTRKELLIAFLLDLNPTVSKEEIATILTEPKKSFPVKVSKIPFDGLD